MSHDNSAQRPKPWWSSKWGRDKICPITHVRLRPGNKVKTLRCGHSFLKKAIDDWIKNNNTCPLCRQKIKPAVTVNNDPFEIWI